MEEWRCGWVCEWWRGKCVECVEVLGDVEGVEGVGMWGYEG